MKNLKRLLFLTVFIVGFVSCNKKTDIDDLEPLKTGNQFLLTRNNFDNTTVPWFMTNRLVKFDEFAYILEERTFQERYGEIDFNRDFSYITDNQDTVKLYFAIKDNGERNIVLSSKNQNTNGVFVISENFALTEDNIIGTPINKELIDGLFIGVKSDNVDTDETVLANELPDGCYNLVWDDACVCLIASSYDWTPTREPGDHDGTGTPGNPNNNHGTGFPSFDPGGPFVGGHGPHGGSDWYPGGHWTKPDTGDEDNSGNIDIKLDKFAWTFISKHLRNFKSTYGLEDFTTEELYNIIGRGCFTIDRDEDGVVMGSSMDEDCAKDAITNEIFTKFGITDQETKDWVNDNPELWDDILINFKDDLVEWVPGDPVLSQISDLCPELFDFDYVDGSNVVQEAGISEISIQLTIGGANRVFSFGNMIFSVNGSSVNCGQSHGQSAAEAIRLAIQQTQNAINSNNIPFGVKMELYKNISINFRKIVSENCSPNFGSVKLWQKTILNDTDHTISTNFINDYSSLCN